jgi:hypothetical protein
VFFLEAEPFYAGQKRSFTDGEQYSTVTKTIFHKKVAARVGNGANYCYICMIAKNKKPEYGT